MKIRVSSTRMELLKLRRRLNLAVRGHRLLKDKQDELVRQFFLRQEEYRSHLKELWQVLGKARLSYDFLKASCSRPGMHLACESSVPAPPVETGNGRVLNLTVPVYQWRQGRPAPLYGLLEGAGPLETVLATHLVLIPQLVRKGQLEKSMAIILREIEITKRRVNALEYNLIPSLRDSIAAIASKLSELELSTLTRLMRVKEIIDREPAASGARPSEPGSGSSSR